MLQVPGLRAPPGQLTIARILPCSSLTGNFWPQSSVFFLSFVLVTVPPDLVDTDSTLGAPLGDQTVKNLPQMQETQVWSMGKEDPPRGGHRDPLQYSYLEKRMDRGAWWATVHGVAKTQTQLSDPERAHTHTHTHTHTHIHTHTASSIPWTILPPNPGNVSWFHWRTCLIAHYNSETCWARYDLITKVPTSLQRIKLGTRSKKAGENVKVKFAQSCPTLCEPMDYTVQGIL